MMDRLARGVSWLFNPLLSLTWLAAALFVVHVRWRAEDLVFWLLLAVVPALILVGGIRAGLWSDLDVSNLRERRTYLPWASLSAAALAVWAFLAEFPVGLRFAAVAIAVWLCMTTGISTLWKISIHEGATVGVIVLCAYLVSHTLAAALVWAPALVAWARLRLRKHTLGQVVAGAALAAAASAVALAVSPP